CFLQRAGALGLAAVARSAASGPTGAGDFCSTAQGASRRLFVPRDRGYLGRLELRGKPLTLMAARAAGLPRGTIHGVLAYRARHDGRDYMNPTLVVRRGE